MGSQEGMSQWEMAFAQLSHATLLLLNEGQPKTKFELGRFASDYSTEKARRLGQDTSLLTKRVANAALRYLVKSGFVKESKMKFTISNAGASALKRYPEAFTVDFVQSEMLTRD